MKYTACACASASQLTELSTDPTVRNSSLDLGCHCPLALGSDFSQTAPAALGQARRGGNGGALPLCRAEWTADCSDRAVPPPPTSHRSPGPITNERGQRRAGPVGANGARWGSSAAGWGREVAPREIRREVRPDGLVVVWLASGGGGAMEFREILWSS